MTRRLLVFLTVINLLNYLDRYIMAAVLPSVMRQFMLTQEEGGMLVAAFVPGYVIFSPLFGYLGDRFSRPRLMAVGVVLWSLATLLSAVAPNFWILAAARVLVGIGEASFASIAPGYIKDQLQNPIRVNSALSLFFAAIPVGAALGFVLGGQIAQHFTWQAAFLAGGIPGLVLAPLLLRLAEIPGRQTAAVGVLAGIRQIMQVEILWYVIGGYVLNAYALNGVAAFVSSYGESIGFTLGEVGSYFGIILVVSGMLGTWGGGRIASHFAARSPNQLQSLLLFSGMTALLGVPFLVLAFSSSNQAIFLLGCFLAELLVFAGTAPINSILVVSCPAALVTLTQGFTILAINLLGALPAPIIVGAIWHASSLRLGMLSLALVLCGCAVIWTVGSRRSKLIS
ncbi:MAG: MFS transporter [Oligoflexia bacterium]|nr:MFS transporter [Oligoflexia bacterium]